MHSPYGTPVHAPWALAINGRLRERYGVDAAGDGHRRRHRAAHPRDRPGPARRRADRLRARRDRADRHHRGGRLGAVRLPLPRVRCPGPAAAAPRPRPTRAAVAAAAALRPAARGGRALPVVPDHPGDDPRGAPGRLRPALAGGAAPAHLRAPAAAGRRQHPAAVAVRAVAAVRLRRRVHVRRRLPHRRAPGRRPHPRPGPARRAARSCRAARAARPRGARRGRVRAPAAGRGPPGPRQRGHRRPAPAARSAVDRRGPGALHDSRPGDRLALAAGRRPPRRAGADGRSRTLGRRRGRRPAARRARRARAAGRAGRLHRAGRGPARRPGRPLRPHPRAVPRRRGGRSGSASASRSASRRWPGSPRRVACSRASSGRRVPAPSGATPRCCGSLRRRSLARLRHEVEPVEPVALARFLPAWQNVGGGGRGCAGSTAWSPSSSSSPGAPYPPRRWSPSCSRPGCATTSPACSTSSPRPARCCGPVTAACPAPTAGSPCTSPTPLR